MNGKIARLLRQYSRTLGIPEEKIKQAFLKVTLDQRQDALEKMKLHIRRIDQRKGQEV